MLFILPRNTYLSNYIIVYHIGVYDLYQDRPKMF